MVCMYISAPLFVQTYSGKELVVVLTLTFYTVHGCVSKTEQIFGLIAILWEYADADTSRDAQFVAV